jgi:Family of unknown function (DUF6221)
VTDDPVARLKAGLDEDEATAKSRTCIHCGGRTAPLRNMIGVTGYTHDSWNPETETRDGWEGQRCPGRLTGAEPVQDPARTLRRVAAHRKILARHDEAQDAYTKALDAHARDAAPVRRHTTAALDRAADVMIALSGVVRDLAAVYGDDDA